jgi:flagellar assembly protein FliH
MSLSKGAPFSRSELEAISVWRLPDISDPATGEICLHQAKSEPVNIDLEPTPVLTVDEIEAMQKQAYEEAFEQGRQEGYQQGFEQGYQDGSNKGYQQNIQLLNTKVAAFEQLMSSLSEPFKSLDDEVEKELVKLAISVATQIIRREIKLDPGQVVAAVRKAVSVLPLSSQKVQLHLHPEDADLVRSALSLDDMSPAWSVVEDPLITRGGCTVDTDVSHIDATIENRLAAVIANLLGGEREHDLKDAGKSGGVAQTKLQPEKPQLDDTLAFPAPAETDLEQAVVSEPLVLTPNASPVIAQAELP